MLLCNQIERDSLCQYPNQPSASEGAVPASAAASIAKFLHRVLVPAQTNNKGFASNKGIFTDKQVPLLTT